MAPAGVTARQNDPRVDSMLEYVWHEIPFGSAKTMLYMGTGIAIAADQMRAGEWHAAEDTLLLLLAGMEQAALDGGNWDLGWLLTHLPEPPWGSVSTMPARTSLRPFAKLADPAWVAAAVAYTKDAALIAEATKPKVTPGPSGKKKGDGKGAGDKDD